MAYKIVKKDELMHYGLAGQKKGVRRYQNADGSLTQEGMARYGVGIKKKTASTFAEQVQQQKEAKATAFKNKVQRYIYDKKMAEKKQESEPEKEKQIGNTEFYGHSRPDGTYVITEEDMTWTLPKGVSPDGLADVIEAAEEKVTKVREEKGKAYSNDDYVSIISEAINNYISSKQKSISHSDELMHYGILGMRWGIRRYQNLDGSLTPAGRKRYADGDISPDHYVLPDSRQPYQLSNQELKDRISRIELENKYIKYEEDMATNGRKQYDKWKAALIGAISTAVIALGIKYFREGVSDLIDAKKAAKAVAKEAAKETTKEAAKETAKEAIKQVAK